MPLFFFLLLTPFRQADTPSGTSPPTLPWGHGGVKACRQRGGTEGHLPDALTSHLALTDSSGSVTDGPNPPCPSPHPAAHANVFSHNGFHLRASSALCSRFAVGTTPTAVFPRLDFAGLMDCYKRSKHLAAMQMKNLIKTTSLVSLRHPLNTRRTPVQTHDQCQGAGRPLPDTVHI